MIHNGFRKEKNLSHCSTLQTLPSVKTFEATPIQKKMFFFLSPLSRLGILYNVNRKAIRVIPYNLELPQKNHDYVHEPLL